MHTMTDPITHPEYARAYHHYLSHGQAPVDAARLAREHVEKYLAANPPSLAKRRPGLVALIVMGCFVAGVAALFAIGSIDSPAAEPGAGDPDRSQSARLVCEDFVRERLKAPATADFSGLFGTDVTRSGDSYNVAGTVDAENSFGAKLRHSYRCDVTLSGDEWTLQDLYITE